MRFIVTFGFVCLFFTLSYAQNSSFRVMSFNLRLPHPGDGIHYWDHRRPLVTSLIRYHAPDLIGVQEAFRRQLDEITADLPEYAWFGVCRTDGTVNPDPDNEFSAILYRKDRFEFLDGNTFWLSSTPEIIGSKGWDAALPRIVTWIKFKDRSSGKTFYHFNTHFDHVGEQAREESARLLLSKIEKLPDDFPVILTGDFNCTDKSKPYMVLIDVTTPFHLSDAIYLSTVPHHGGLVTFSSDFMCPENTEPGRIDYVFIHGDIAVMKHAILSDSWNGSLASDHLPVIAEIRIK